MEQSKFLGIRPAFLLGEKYRLDLTWKKVNYNQEGLCLLDEAKFSGPALGFAEQIQGNDHIYIDFYKQYYVKVSNIYIGKLSWGDVVYDFDSTVHLVDCVLSHETELNNVPKLKDSDYLVLDTKGHDREVHAFNLTYPAYVVNADAQLYNFGV